MKNLYTITVITRTLVTEFITLTFISRPPRTVTPNPLVKTQPINQSMLVHLVFTTNLINPFGKGFTTPSGFPLPDLYGGRD